MDANKRKTDNVNFEPILDLAIPILPSQSTPEENPDISS
mgnify:CR=1 FL=1